MLNRRGLLGVLGGLIAGPSIVRASSLMAVKVTDIQHVVRITGRDAAGGEIAEYVRVMESLARGLDMEMYRAGTEAARPRFAYVTDISWTKGLLKPIVSNLPENALNGKVEERMIGLIRPSRTNGGITGDGGIKPHIVDGYYHDPVGWRSRMKNIA